MVNLDNVRKWTTALRETNSPQTQGRLARDLGGGEIGYCCLGLGCEVAGIPSRSQVFGGDEPVIHYAGSSDLAPRGFHDWLDNGQTRGDVHLDWPHRHYEQRYDESATYGNPWMGWTCAGLNDDCGLTFSQIADMIDYFGIKEGDQ